MPDYPAHCWSTVGLNQLPHSLFNQPAAKAWHKRCVSVRPMHVCTQESNQLRLSWWKSASARTDGVASICIISSFKSLRSYLERERLCFCEFKKPKKQTHFCQLFKYDFLWCYAAVCVLILSFHHFLSHLTFNLMLLCDGSATHMYWTLQNCFSISFRICRILGT